MDFCDYFSDDDIELIKNGQTKEIKFITSPYAASCMPIRWNTITSDPDFLYAGAYLTVEQLISESKE